MIRTATPERARRLVACATAGACALGIATITDAYRAPDDGHSAGADIAAARSAASPAGQRAVATSFGSLTVHAPRVTRGVSARALAGQSHGINDYVPPERALVQVPVTLYNAGDEPVDYDAARFGLMLRTRGSKRDTGSAELASSSLRSGTLPSGATVEADLAFVVPRNGADMYLRFQDGVRTLRVPLGDAGPVYRPQVGDHANHGAGRTAPVPRGR